MLEEFKNLKGDVKVVDHNKNQKMIRFKNEKFEKILEFIKDECNQFGIDVGQIRVQIEDNSSYFVKRVNENCEVNSGVIPTSGGMLLSGFLNL